MKKISRRDFLKLSGLALFSAAGAWTYARYIEPGWLDVHFPVLRLPGLGPAFAGFRLAHVSDIHLGGWMNRERLARVVDVVLAAEPDAVALTGDFVYGHRQIAPETSDGLRAELARLAAVLPVFGVLGNHDYWTDPGRVRAVLAAAGVQDLTNRSVSLARGAERLYVAGLDDAWEGDPQVERVADEIPDGGAAILLVHEPDIADRSARTGRFALQLSGHTHGGQVAIPLIGMPVLPYMGHKYPSGLYRVGRMLQYTNRGVGVAGLAVRFNCRPEITVFVLEPEKS
jgi:predicted MPP superfamily phosphohydrolase